MPSTLEMWRKFSPRPLGTRLFSWGVCLRAPYFRTVRPHIVRLEPGYCEVRSKKRRAVHNHIGTFHAIAACNVAEVAAGVLAEASVPATHRWIPVGMAVRYVAKASTDVVGVAELNPLPEPGDEPAEWVVPVRILDTSGEPVVTADITLRVSPKKKTAAAKS
ncbi:hotdog fold domain-containing protein [Saccharopolyspora sp. NFXS83]|uniref:hotdog fold domain-containing protein n=1 Tax=Saccharopolyspora sp. NFXS83 TaxID=2993560 RepID=UPI00224B84D0|nr:hotdog fold domain-containing protein [Saccharopolyspora sp. NFXS83]MCX2733831.1 hotdog fold domain-containing protein [Saccharopolyspora sp. NFXS83]